MNVCAPREAGDGPAAFDGCNYAFSVVMAIYNAEPYLREAVESLENQTFGFRNIQLILVDDGSTDGSPAICDAIRAGHPDNVVVIHQKNSGVSAARNAGLARVQGRYVNFLDSDDRLSENTMAEVHAFFEAHGSETDVACIPMFYFDAATQPHIHNFKFDKGQRVADLLAEWDFPHASASSSFISAELAAGLRFDPRVRYSEDALFINQALLRKCKVGLLTGCSYGYRKRTEGSSAMDRARFSKSWYLPSARYFLEGLMDAAQVARGEVPLFIQYNVMFDLQWRLGQQAVPFGVLTAEEVEAYRQTLERVLRRIDDRVIAAQRFLSEELKFFAIGLKHAEEPKRQLYAGMDLYSYGDYGALSFEQVKASYTSIDIRGDRCLLNGYVGVPVRTVKNVAAGFRSGSAVYPCVLSPAPPTKCAPGWTICENHSFALEIPLDPKAENCLTLCLELDGKTYVPERVDFSPSFPIAGTLIHDYALIGEYCLMHDGQKLVIRNRALRPDGICRRDLRSEIKGCMLADPWAVMRARQRIKAYQRKHRPGCLLIAAGECTKPDGLWQLIKKLQAEEPKAEICVILAPGVPKPDGGIAAFYTSVHEWPYILRYMSAERICCARRDWAWIFPFGEQYGLFGSLRKHGVQSEIDAEGHVVGSWQTSGPRNDPGYLLKLWLRGSAANRMAGRIAASVRRRIRA